MSKEEKMRVTIACRCTPDKVLGCWNAGKTKECKECISFFYCTDRTTIKPELFLECVSCQICYARPPVRRKT